MKSPQLNRVTGVELAAGVLVGFVAYEVINALVGDLVAPLIALFIGDSRFELNAFVIEGIEFRYGEFLEALLIAAVTAIVLVTLADRAKGWRKLSGDERECPECTSAISVNASRCPYCTAQLNRGSTSG